MLTKETSHDANKPKTHNPQLIIIFPFTENHIFRIKIFTTFVIEKKNNTLLSCDNLPNFGCISETLLRLYTSYELVSEKSAKYENIHFFITSVFLFLSRR